MIATDGITYELRVNDVFDVYPSYGKGMRQGRNGKASKRMC